MPLNFNLHFEIGLSDNLGIVFPLYPETEAKTRREFGHQYIADIDADNYCLPIVLDPDIVTDN